MTNYILNHSITFNCGFALTPQQLLESITQTNSTLALLPPTLYRSIDYKTTSAMIGCLLCENIAQSTNGTAIVNPIEKGHPDIVPAEASNCTEEELRNYQIGLEIKCTVGNTRTGCTIPKAASRIPELTSITWQAHHQEVTELLGITFDYINCIPIITACFYSSELTTTDWGHISGTTGRNTKVCGMTASGKRKMGQGWVAVLNNDIYIDKYNHIFRINIPSSTD